MARRLAVDELAPHMHRAMRGLERASRESAVEPGLQHLVRLRVSQVNGCAYCVGLHLGHAREEGVAQRKLDLLAVWRESAVFDGRERAALALAEAATRLSEGPVGEGVWAAAAAEFGEVELAELVWVIATINTWNRVVAMSGGWR